mmetsp:Transcript_30222/g.42121  ORF Transcript_30222/g.42121 Transcript_30222/m.42121 type:complete len:288 (-) Transcript_30222:165-1028(-)|eukprot:CAMPEP_0185263438 /NCGR_PEP_ID=MMETSP1359-20130426/15196_1 /TAXON_ID=552665 /ORGANISM="Bigelowiella longifila, Strain CCMP242" /LENGTH=287 /DNA_ID=CAMNT_0027850987 /DNA_START=73 /DNA_END=936 /DNA_ORIENTATION=-
MLVKDILYSVLLSVLTILGELVFLVVNPILLLKKTLTAKKKSYTSILITGASQGIGAELAKLYAKPGVHLYLVARNEANLKKVKAQCSKASKVTIFPMSVDNEEGMRKIINEADSEKPLDLVIANAGIPDGKIWFERQVLVGKVTYMGVIYTVVPALEKMRERKSGQVVIMSSLSAYQYGWRDAPAYAAAKAGMLAWGRSLRERLLKRYKIGVTTICPGFILTDIVVKEMKKKDVDWAKSMGALQLEPATKLIKKAIDYNEAEYCFPKLMELGAKLKGRFHYPYFVN